MTIKQIIFYKQNYIYIIDNFLLLYYNDFMIIYFYQIQITMEKIMMKNNPIYLKVPKYSFYDKPFEDIISKIAEDIKKIEEPKSEGIELLELFKSKYNISDEIFSSKDFHKTMREILKLQNNGMDFPIGARADKTIENWLKGHNPFIQSSEGYSPKQKIIAWMIYMKFSKEEINEFLNRYDYGELYVFDWFDVCALITYMFGENFEYFWNLQNRKDELFDKANRIILIQKKDTEETPAVKVHFGSITAIEGNENSLVWFINKYKNDFGRAHLSVYNWLIEMLSFSYSDNQNKMIINLIDEELALIDKWTQNNRKIMMKNIQAEIRDKTNTPKYNLYGQSIKNICDCRKALDKFCVTCNLREDNIVVAHLNEIIEENTDNNIKLFTRLIGEYHERIDFLNVLCEQDDLSRDAPDFVKLVSSLKEGPAKFDSEVSNFILKLRKAEAKKGLEELKITIKDIDKQITQIDDINDRKIGISRNFLILNILQNMSNKYLIEKIHIEAFYDVPNSQKRIIEKIIKTINKSLSKFGFRKLSSAYRIDQLLLIAIFNTEYEYIDLYQYPYRRFIEGIDQNRYLEFRAIMEKKYSEERYYNY